MMLDASKIDFEFWYQMNFKLTWCVEHHFMKHRTNSNIIFRTLNELEHVHLLVIALEHPIFGFEGSNIERLALTCSLLKEIDRRDIAWLILILLWAVHLWKNAIIRWWEPFLRFKECCVDIRLGSSFGSFTQNKRVHSP